MGYGENRSRGPRKEGGFRGGDFREREMHDATCADCGVQTQVPFKPADGRPVYCRDCYRKKKAF